jgi:biopolymer transport protein ExbB/biopolymer transport protein TolQ
MGLDILELWGTMGWFAKFIVYLLLLMSFFSIAIGIRRWYDLMRSRRQVLKFAPELSSALESNDLPGADLAVSNYPLGHLACAYKGVFSSLAEHVSDRQLGDTEVGAILRTIELNKLEQLARFRRGLGVLATVGATAPFVGLLGTTMGVVNAFTGMATAGSGGLSAISAGIAEALITTAFGLAVAIPAVWLYNYFTNRIELVSMEIDYGSKEFMNFLLAIESRLSKGLEPFAARTNEPQHTEPATA